jgi:nucleoside-diphosphate-sugar epimerase
MRVFVTGASGHIASAVIPELLAHGHQVTGLARSGTSAVAVEALGAEVRRGDLDDLDGLSQAASQADGVIHLAFKHEEMRTGDVMSAVDADAAAITAMGEALTGTGKPFVTTGGTLMLAMAGINDRPGTEDDRVPGGLRVDAENYVTGLAGQGVRSSVIRLAPMVHDIGALYRLALEKAPAGSAFHGVGDLGIPRKVIAETIAGRLGVEAKSITEEEAPQYLGFLAFFAALDNPTSNDKTREVLGWEPTHIGWIEDVQTGHYIA